MLIDCRFLAIMVEHPIVVETFQANVGPGWKARASPKSLGFIICDPWMSRQNFINSSMWDFSLDQSSGPIVWQTNITIPWPCLLSWLKNKEMQEAGNTHRLVAQTEATLAGHTSTHWEDGDGGGREGGYRRAQRAVRLKCNKAAVRSGLCDERGGSDTEVFNIVCCLSRRNTSAHNRDVISPSEGGEAFQMVVETW